MFRFGNLKEEPTEEQFASEEGVNPTAMPPSVIAPKQQPEVGPLIARETDLFGDALIHPTVERLRQVIEGEHLFVWGWLAYRDVFPKTRVHLTEFCENLARITVPDTPGVQPVFDFKGCRKHNCVDEHCDDYQQMLKLAAAARK